MSFDLTPRLLTAQDAAAYLSLPLATFVKLGVGRLRLGSRVRFDRVALDAWLDAQFGREAKSAPAGDDQDPEAALARFSQDFRNAPRRS